MLVAVHRDHTVLLEPVIRQLLRDGESLRAAVRVRADPGLTRAVSVRSELVELLNPLNWFGLSAHPGELLRLWTYGRAVAGGEDSAAAAVHTACDNDGRGRALVATSDRLFAVRLDPTGKLEPHAGGYVFETSELLAEWPRAAVVGAAAAPKGLLRRGRFTVSFGDGSWCALIGHPAYHAQVVVTELARAWSPPG